MVGDVCGKLFAAKHYRKAGIKVDMAIRQTEWPKLDSSFEQLNPWQIWAC